jgi:hypothetical protein
MNWQDEQKKVATGVTGGQEFDPYDEVFIAYGLPKREWVGLTDEDFFQKNGSEDFEEGAMWAEAKLKEKNT